MKEIKEIKEVREVKEAKEVKEVKEVKEMNQSNPPYARRRRNESNEGLYHSTFHCFFFFQAEDGIRDDLVTEFRRVLFRSPTAAPIMPACMCAASSRKAPRRRHSTWWCSTNSIVSTLPSKSSSACRGDRKST